MDKKYTLYLDESETHRFNSTTKKDEDYHFCMAGVIVAENDVSALENSINQLKRTIWSDLTNPEDVVLHQMLITKAEKGRLDVAKYPEYARFNKKEKRKKFYLELKKVFDNNKITIIGSSINLEKLQNYYWITKENSQARDLVTMQLLLENYCHFLCTHNGIGNIIYESRELKDDEKLRDKYYHMKLMGSMYMERATAEKRLLGMDFADKSENIAGLQIADFVPNSFARDHAGFGQWKYNIFSTLKNHRYDGSIGQQDRFGVKYMP